MSNATTNITFTSIINLNKGDRDIKKLMRKLLEHGVGKGQCQTIPTFIDLLFPIKFDDKNIKPIRHFLKAIRSIQTESFMRFIGDLDIIMDADCGDIFYSKEKSDQERYKDASWTIQALNPTHVEVAVKVHPLTKTHLNIREVSRMTSNVLYGIKDDHDEDAIHLAMIDFHRSNRFFEISNSCKEDMHVLFLPTGDKRSRHTIPLFGLSAKDAIRRSRYMDKTFGSLGEQYFPFVSDIVQTQQIVQSLVNEITVSKRSGSRMVVAAQTYALAELLFGYYLRAREGENKKNHPKTNFIWFDEIQDDDNSFVEMYAVHITNR